MTTDTTDHKPSFKPEPRDFRQEFADYLSTTSLYNAEYAALLTIARQLVFEREQARLIGFAITHGSRGLDECAPALLHRLRKQNTQ